MNIYIRSQDIDLFKYLSNDECAMLTTKAQSNEYKAGDTIVTHDSILDGMFIVCTGELEMISPAGKSIGSIYTGETAGEVGFTETHPCPISLRCVKDSKILRLSYQVINDFCASDAINAARIQAALNDSLCLKIIRSTHRRNND